MVTTWAILAAAVLITPFAAGGAALAREGLFSRPLVWGGVLYLGVVSTAGAFWLWNKGLGMVEASTGALYFFLQPLVGTLLGWLLLGEKPGAAFWAGAALILGGVLFVVREPAGAGRRAPSPPGASPKQR